MNTQFPINLISFPLVNEPDTLPNRDFCLRQLAKNKWCVCTYLRDYDRYAAGHYFKTKTEAQEYFNLRVIDYLEYYQELVTDQQREIERKDILLNMLGDALTSQQRDELLPLAIKVAELDTTTNKYRLCSLLLKRGFRSVDPNEINDIIDDIKDELASNLISII